jgi:hypothetical protein
VGYTSRIQRVLESSDARVEADHTVMLKLSCLFG